MKLMDIVQKMGFVLLMIGVSGMDSDNLIIPVILTLAGAIILFVTSAMEYESGEEEE